jgi:hypothetical protein
MIVMNEDILGGARIQKGKTSQPRATIEEDIKLKLVNGFPAPTLTTNLRSYHSNLDYSQDEGVAGLALLSFNSYDLFDSPNEGIGRCFMAQGPKVSHPEYLDFNIDDDDLLGDDDLLNGETSDVSYNELASNHDSQDEMNDNAMREIERLAKELNTLELSHETTQEYHRELLRTHEKLRFKKLNLEQEHEFLKAINDDLRKKSSSYIAKHLG